MIDQDTETRRALGSRPIITTTGAVMGMITTCFLALLLAMITGCAPVDVQPIVDAKASNEQARAAAEWARTAQAQAEAAEAIKQAPARAQARTLAIVATVVVGVGVLAGLGASLVAWAWMRARLVFADKSGLYPVVIGTAPATNLNEPGAQHARIAPHRNPVQIAPPLELDAIPVIPQPIELDAQRLQHIERLLLEPPAGVDYDDTD